MGYGPRWTCANGSLAFGPVADRGVPVKAQRGFEGCEGGIYEALVEAWETVTASDAGWFIHCGYPVAAV